MAEKVNQIIFKPTMPKTLLAFLIVQEPNISNQLMFWPKSFNRRMGIYYKQRFIQFRYLNAS